MVIATRNTSGGNNSGELEGSMRDLVMSLQESVNQMNQSVQLLSAKVATMETGQTYLNNELFEVRLASIHLYDKALAWHRQFEKINGDVVTWEIYEAAIYKRFGPCYEDRMEEIKNLRQNGTVTDYQDQFEALVSRVELTESQAISCFVAGLQEDIGMMVKMFKPKSLYDAYQLARMQETVKTINTKRYTPILPTPKHSGSSAIVNRSTTPNVKPPITQLALPSTPFNKSTNAGNVEEMVEEPVVYPHISLNALAGVNTFHTMRIKGHVGKQDIHILVDSGTTHNFVDVQCAKKLGCEIRSICPLQVEVPGGNQMPSTTVCRSFNWNLQGQEFQSDVMLLPLGGCDMVLGVQWLTTLGDIKWNFHTLRMEFTFKGKKITLRGTQQATLQWMNGKDYGRILTNSKVALEAMSLCVYPITLMKVSVENTQVQHFNEAVSQLLEEFHDAFAVPNTLPPHRAHDHRIVLQEGIPPVNVRPYKHTPTQKDAIELMVKELLETGVIRSSHSPFSSPIVMVKKKDGTWRMCIGSTDYAKQEIQLELSKYALFVALAHPYTATNVAQAFLDNVYKLHGLPQTIMYDMGKAKGMGSVVVIGRVPTFTQVSTLLLLRRAQDRMKAIADGHRTERSYEVGDMVYLKLQPYRQITVRKGVHHKLSSKFYGPFKVLEKIGEVAYKLQLRSTTKVHPVFHVSQLKRCKTPEIGRGDFPTCTEEGLIAVEPEKILDKWLQKKGNSATVYGSGLRTCKEEVYKFISLDLKFKVYICLALYIVTVNVGHDRSTFYFANAPESARMDWSSFTKGYFLNRESLVSVLLLVDASVPPQKIDLDCANWLGRNNIPMTIVFTKCDKMKNTKGKRPDENIQSFQELIKENYKIHPPWIMTSSATGLGRDDLLLHMSQLRNYWDN
nr:hypothetical protein [Tanacetum cinerariifolium]